ncbi:MAG: MBL fold metallo-hydrolase [Candidatus Krumholzibacteria bacterium]|nr:MBL fold metallo-hydrolase [Candidatus Krumholzibacteria bacterium]MDH4338179.1 MBL fold metallo-hydrolase [Candidatus Krumholzibacteria bacterium]MDH5269832.1 MBL fold metallo-hydrolase [Candidatus Krumholzibacteria bacterium]MDH5628272.1 MBL fold metallo-hydrolase [Candidatus Krumholzibacteria bacterium]
MNYRFGFSRIAVMTALALMVASVSPAQQDEDVRITSTRVSGNVYMLEGQGGNIGACVGDDGILIIDDQFARLAEKIRAALRELNPGPVEFILNTHYHGDHVGGNPVFGKEGTIIAHENVRKRVSTQQVSGDRVRDAIDPAGWPVVTFADAVTIHFNGEDIRFLHLPAGHTDGDGVVYFPKANVIHTGDLMFTGKFPRVDFEGGGSVEGYAAALTWVLENIPPDAKVIPGHGALSSMEDVRRQRDMIVETQAFVRAQVKAGKSLAEIQQAGLPDEYESFDWKFITTSNWVDDLYRSVTASN